MPIALRAPGWLETHWRSEDVLFGIASRAAMGEEPGIEMLVIDALVVLDSVMQADDASAGRCSFPSAQHTEARP